MQETKIPRLKSAEGLYCILKEAFQAWKESPGDQTEKDFLFMCLGLNHLREWIVAYEDQTIIRETSTTASERLRAAKGFYSELGRNDEYKLVRGICNASKHVKLDWSRREPETSFETGADIGADLPMSFTRDFMIDDRNATEIFEAVLEQYRRWFTEGGDGAS